VVDRPPAYLVDADVAEHLARHGLAVENGLVAAPAVGAKFPDLARVAP
jgi:hypothetical protein